MVNDTCEIETIDEEKVVRVQKQLAAESPADVAEIFKVLADETRVKIAYALSREEELCVCDVAHVAGASTATTSYHLRLLKKRGLAKFRKEGKLAYYSLDDEHVKQLVSIAFAHQKEAKQHDER